MEPDVAAFTYYPSTLETEAGDPLGAHELSARLGSVVESRLREAKQNK